MKSTNTMFASRLAMLKYSLDKFFLSDYYIVLLGALAFAGWLSGFWIPFIFVMLVLTIIMFCVCQNTMPVFPLMWFFLYTVSTSQEDIGKYWWMLFVILPLVASMVYNLIRNKPDIKAVLSPQHIKRSTL